MSKSLRSLLFFSLLLALPIAAGCGGDEAKKGGTVNTSLAGGDPGKLAFDLGTSDVGQIARNIFDGLTDTEAKSGRTVPKVADSFSHNKELTEWTFKLKRDYKFCNGEPVTAASFKAGWEATVDPAQKSSVAYHFAGIKGTDDAGNSTDLTGVTTPEQYTLKVNLKEGDNIFATKTSHPAFQPVPVKHYKAHKKDFARKPVGNGPFCVTAYKPDRVVEMKANPYYEGKDRIKPKLKQLNFRIYPSDDAAWKAFQAGTVQDALVPLVQIPKARKLPDATYFDQPQLGVYYYGFKVNQKPWNGESGKLLRQAINYAIDRENIVKNIYEDDAVVATGFTPPGVEGYKADLSPYDYNPSKAKKLLKEAGYPNGKGLEEQTLGFNTGSRHEEVAAAVAKNLDSVGIKMKSKGVADFEGTFIPQIAAGKIPFFRLSWFADYPSYQNFLQPNFDSATIPDGNLQYWRSDKFDRLLSEAAKEPKAAEANKLYRKAEKVLFEDPPVAPIFFFKSDRIVSDDIGGFESTPLDFTPFEKVYLK